MVNKVLGHWVDVYLFGLVIRILMSVGQYTGRIKPTHHGRMDGRRKCLLLNFSVAFRNFFDIKWEAIIFPRSVYLYNARRSHLGNMGKIFKLDWETRL
jgi:hypothetical protein